MKSFIDFLRCFNTKERYFLIGQVLGNSEFSLSTEFVSILENTLKINVNTDNIFVALDYHLDWVYGSLVLYFSGECHEADIRLFQNKNGSERKMIQGTQEDSDLLICYKHNDNYHIIFIEAKGVMPWNKKQLHSKINRLRNIFGDLGTKWENVIPHFLIISPNKPLDIELPELPKWASFNGDLAFIKLNLPKNLMKITRCDSNYKDNKAGQYWKIDTIRIDKNAIRKQIRTTQLDSGSTEINTIASKLSQRWTNFFSDKYLENQRRLNEYFPEAYKFLKDIEELEKYDFHIGTAVNMHFYYQSHFLFYFCFHSKSVRQGNPISFSSNYNLQLKHDAQDYSPELFFIPLLQKISNKKNISRIKLEKRGTSKRGKNIDEYFIYPSDESYLFFDYCKEVIAEIAGKNKTDIFA